MNLLYQFNYKKQTNKQKHQQQKLSWGYFTLNAWYSPPLGIAGCWSHALIRCGYWIRSGNGTERACMNHPAPHPSTMHSQMDPRSLALQHIHSFPDTSRIALKIRRTQGVRANPKLILEAVIEQAGLYSPCNKTNVNHYVFVQFTACWNANTCNLLCYYKLNG